MQLKKLFAVEMAADHSLQADVPDGPRLSLIRYKLTIYRAIKWKIEIILKQK